MTTYYYLVASQKFLEEEAIEKPNYQTLTKIYQIRRELLAFRRLVWPQREIFNSLIRDGSDHN